MDIVEALLQLNRVAGDVDQPTDLQIGTVVKAPPDDDVLEISINTEMATLRQDILYLAEPVIEKKIPLLKHRHAMPHIHAGVHGSTGSPSEPALRGRRQLCTERGHQRLGEWKSPFTEQG